MFNSIRKRHRIAQAVCLLGGLFVFSAPAAQTLFWHPVRLDDRGRLLAWPEGDSPYSQIVCRAWDRFKKIPVQPSGYKTYFLYPVFYGPADEGKDLFEGRDWTHNPGGLFAMLTDSGLLYYRYSGDASILPLIGEMLDHLIARGSTSPNDAWAAVPFASSDSGDPNYRGATESRYSWDSHYLGRGDGVGFLEPDKVGEIGLAYLRYYKVTLQEKYFQAACRCAEALVRHVTEGSESRSPWPFRVDAKTGKIIKEAYTSNAIGPIRLLDEMIQTGRGDTESFRKTRQIAWDWLMRYPVQNNNWTQYFEDIYIYPDYRTNLNHYCPLETARYLLENPQADPQGLEHAKRLISWVRDFFAVDSTTMAGLPEKGRQWGAEVISEQINDMDKMTSHTARYASLLALLHEKTGDPDALERAYRSFNWASYGCRQDGLVKTSLDEGTGYWFSDGYGDYMRHFLRGMASVPQWAPKEENHLLASRSVVRSIRYTPGKIVYVTYDPASVETFKLKSPPQKICLQKEDLPLVSVLQPSQNGYTISPVAGGGFTVIISHNKSGEITIFFDS